MHSQSDVTNYWESEVCGTRFASDIEERKLIALQIERTRYQCEPYIPDFAGFKNDNSGKRVLEIGVGAGTDFIQWIRSGAECYGVDATNAAIQETTANIESILQSDIRPKFLGVASAENLPFEDNYFDIVYSHGVLHHATNTMKCISEAVRVLKPGGTIKLMVYSTFSATGIMLWGIHALLKGKPFQSQEKIIFKHLESPGTKCYSCHEFSKILKGFGLNNVKIKKFAGSGDLLMMPPSHKYRSNPAYKWIMRAYPRFLVRNLQGKLGLALTATSLKS
jgi:ubiquinone/menaquinone biosynthesis C-methylase UbiE